MAIPERENSLPNGNHKQEDSRLHPSKVRVKFFESQQVTQVACTPPPPDVTLDFASDSMASPVSDQSAAAYARQTSAESGVDNPFRPDGELSREADTIVSLIKEGKPITPVKGEEDQDLKMMDGDPAVVHNGLHTTTTPADQTDSVVTASRDSPLKQEVVPAPATAKPLEKSNGTTPNATPAVVEVQHGVISPPSDTPQVEQVTIKKKPKCKCCVIQ